MSTETVLEMLVLILVPGRRMGLKEEIPKSKKKKKSEIKILGKVVEAGRWGADLGGDLECDRNGGLTDGTEQGRLKDRLHPQRIYAKISSLNFPGFDTVEERMMGVQAGRDHT